MFKAKLVIPYIKEKIKPKKKNKIRMIGYSFFNFANEFLSTNLKFIFFLLILKLKAAFIIKILC
jgi:hypothetical protein